MTETNYMEIDAVAEAPQPKQRVAGVLAHPTSFPSPYGIGDLGPSAYEFIDFLQKAGQHLWQVLPLGPTGFGDSPYQGFSAFAGQPLIISPDMLVKLHLISQEELNAIPHPQWDPKIVDYGQVLDYKNAILEKSYETFLHTADKMLLEEYDVFCEAQDAWLTDYAFFMALKSYHNGMCWLEWDASLKNPTIMIRQLWEEKLKKEIGYYKFIQFIFFRQWTSLKEYANEKDIKIIGDIPIFVALDSADVWANQELFQLDTKGYPKKVAGVPPDYFSETGQLWGNPLYDWDHHKKDGYSWWIERIRCQLQMVDYLRIDHFRGFEAYWAVPGKDETAVGGNWKKGPNADFFQAIEEQLGTQLPIFAEDLGVITPEVEKLRDSFGFPGMKVLQFAFESEGESTFLPHQFTTPNCICYTGTHDNDTTRGWYDSTCETNRDKVRRYMNIDGNNVSWDFIRLCISTIATYAVYPVQDILRLDGSRRMNIPGTQGSNWSFRFEKGDLTNEMAEGLRSLCQLFGRY